MRRTPLRLAASAAVVVATPGALQGQGFQVNEHGTCVMARAGTGVASACRDGSAIYFNPAGIAGMSGITVSGGATLIIAQGTFTDDATGQSTSLDNKPIPVLHAYVVYPITDQLTAGFGTFVPYGLGTSWPIDFEGRFSSYDADLRSIYLQPTLAYQINDRIAIGAGFDFVIGFLELNRRLDLSTQPAPAPAPVGTTLGQLGIPFHTEFADAKLRATGATGIGGNFGIWVRPIDRLSFGVRYLTRVKLDYTGTATFEPVPTGIILPAGNPFMVPGGTPLDAVVMGAFSAGAPLADGDVTATIWMPDQLIAGVAVDVTSSLKLLADWQWVNWSVFDVLVAEFSNAMTPTLTLEEAYEDTHGFRFGFDWAANDQWNIRGGYLHHQGASPPQTVTPLLPEGTRNEVTAGVGIKLSEKFTVDLAYQYILQNDRRGRVREVPAGTPPSQVVTDINSGLYQSHAHLLGATFTVRF